MRKDLAVCHRAVVRGVAGETIIAAASLCVAVVAIFSGYWAAKKYGTRKGSLVLDAKNLRLVPIHLVSPEGKLTVIEPNPKVQFSVELRLRNTGKDDIGEAAFGGRPLVIQFGTDVVDLQVSSGPSGELLTRNRSVEIAPRTIPSGCSWHWFVRCVNEEPFVTVASPIIDVDFRVRVHKPGIDSGQSLMGGWSLKGSGKWLKGRVHRY